MSEVWDTITRQISEEVGDYMKDGALQPPIRGAITDNDDALVVEFEIGESGKCTLLSPSVPLPEALPLFLTMTDSTGKEMEAIFSEEVVSKLRKPS